MPSLLLRAPVAALAWLGRQGTRAIAALVFLGIAVPPLDALLRPYVAEAIFVLLVIAFLRVEPAALRGTLRRPGVALAATAWTMLGVPLLFGAGCLATGLGARAPGLFLALMLQAVASPMMAAPSLAALMGLDATLVLVALVLSTALVPLTAPLFASAFLGAALTLSPLALGVKLFAILAGSLLTAALLRRFAGAAALARHKDALDGFNILVLFVFVAAVMEQVAARTLADPWTMLGLAALACAVSAALVGLTAWVFARAGAPRAFALGLLSAQRNMGLMLAATGGALPEVAYLYFAMSQFPIYLAPWLLRNFAERVVAEARE